MFIALHLETVVIILKKELRPVGLRFCGYFIMNILYISRAGLQNVIKWTRTKKIFAVVSVLILVIFVLWNTRSFQSSTNKWLSPQDSVLSKRFQSCLQFEHLTYQKVVDSYGAFIGHVPSLPNENILLPYVGNGFIAVETEDYSHIYIKYGRTLNTEIPYVPIFGIQQNGEYGSRSLVLNIEEGMVHRIQCFQADNFCVNVKKVIYAHRRRPSILVQELHFSNPTSSAMEFDIISGGFQSWPSADIKNFKLSVPDLTLNVSFGVAAIPSLDSSRSFVVSVLAATSPERVKLMPGSMQTFTYMTSVQYREVSTAEDSKGVFKVMENKAREDLKLAYAVPIKKLRQEHSSAWLSLWSSGFYISNSLAAGVVNGHQINKTMYYVLSNIRSPLLEIETSGHGMEMARKWLYYTDRCYGDHHTLQNMRMWSEVSNMKDVINIVNIWMITLEKHGCERMMRAGAEGVLQAMILSYGALRFSNNHLEFRTHPSDLHRDLYFRRINYGSDTHLNISVRVGADNKAYLYVSLDRNNLTYHACDAGCLDPPVVLSKAEVILPVKLTNPVTPILYITSDLRHMEELRHAIHVHSVDEAPAHEHHVIVMHKHGHKWGGLPVLFWATISTLIVIFHLFLFKLVYNEYCTSQDFVKTSRYYSSHSTRRYT